MQNLGRIVFTDGTIRDYFQIGSKGHDSPRITVIESFEDGELKTAYKASGRGIVEVIVDGPVRDMIAAGGKIGAAALLRPSKITVSGVSSSQGTGTGGSGGDVDVRQIAVQAAEASASSSTEQTQNQDQLQGQGQKADGKGNSFVFSNDNNTKKQNNGD